MLKFNFHVFGTVFALLLIGNSAASNNPVSVVNSPVAGAFPLVAAGQAAQLAVDIQDIEVVTVAATAFAG
ncbi:MAG: hypothetical protein LBS25_05440, partial [Candidatus Symbiothrix sp.]|nr:hypothetical protein [Candidatus Symbiothrix sp.]